MNIIYLCLILLLNTHLIFSDDRASFPLTKKRRNELVSKLHYSLCCMQEVQNDLDQELFSAEHPYHSDPLTYKNCHLKTATGVMRSGCDVSTICCIFAGLSIPICVPSFCAVLGDFKACWSLSGKTLEIASKLCWSSCPTATISGSCVVPTPADYPECSLACGIDHSILRYISDPNNWPGFGEQEALLPRGHDTMREDVD